MCTLTAAVFTRNDSRGSLSRRLGTPHVRFAQRLQTGPVHLRQSGSVLDLVLAHVDVSTLQEVTRQSGASISAAFDGCGWIPGVGGLNRNPTPGVGRHVLNSSTTAACRICSLFWAFQNHRSLRYRTQGVIMLSRARYSWLLAGLELPCDAGRLQCRSSTKRGERRGGIASGPEVDAGLRLVGGESAAGLPPARVDVCRARHGPQVSKKTPFLGHGASKQKSVFKKALAREGRCFLCD